MVSIKVDSNISKWCQSYLLFYDFSKTYSPQCLSSFLSKLKFPSLIITIDYVTCVWLNPESSALPLLCLRIFHMKVKKAIHSVWLCFPGPRENDKVLLIHKPTALKSQSMLLNHEALIIQSPDCNQTKNVLSHPSQWKLIRDPTLGNSNKLIGERISRLRLGKLRFLHCFAITQHGFVQTAVMTCSYGNTIPALMGATH